MKKTVISVLVLLYIIFSNPYAKVNGRILPNTESPDINEEEAKTVQEEKRLVNHLSPFLKVLIVFSSAGVATGIILIIMKNKGVEKDE